MNTSLLKEAEPRSSTPVAPTRSLSEVAPEASPKRNKNWIADVALIGVAIIWGVNIPVMKYALVELGDPFSFNALRLTCSAAVLGLCAWLERRSGHRSAPKPSRSRRRTWLRIAIYCALTGGLYQLVFVFGMNKTTSGNTALIVSAMPMWAAVVAWLFAHEKLSKLACAGLVMTLLGTAVVTLQRGGISADSEHLYGNLLVLFATLAWAVASVLSRSVFDSITPTMLAFVACISTLPVHFIAAGSNVVDRGQAALDSPLLLIGLLYSGLFSTGIAYALWNYGVRQVGASHAAVFQNLVPIVALLVAWVFLSEVPAVVQAFGGVMIIGGLLIMRRGRKETS